MEDKNNFIDFDHASKVWKANKKYLGRGVFEYKCRHISEKTNKYCKNKIYKEMFCKYHYINSSKSNLKNTK